MTFLPPAARGPVPAGGSSPATGTNLEIRAQVLRDAEAVITDFAHHPDDELRIACAFIMNHPGVAGDIFKRAEMTLQAIGGGE